MPCLFSVATLLKRLLSVTVQKHILMSKGMGKNRSLHPSGFVGPSGPAPSRRNARFPEQSSARGRRLLRSSQPAPNPPHGHLTPVTILPNFNLFSILYVLALTTLLRAVGFLLLGC